MKTIKETTLQREQQSQLWIQYCFRMILSGIFQKARSLELFIHFSEEIRWILYIVKLQLSITVLHFFFSNLQSYANIFLFFFFLFFSIWSNYNQNLHSILLGFYVTNSITINWKENDAWFSKVCPIETTLKSHKNSMQPIAFKSHLISKEMECVI